MKYAAELFGTFVFLFSGLGTAVLDGNNVGHLGVSLGFGLALLAMVYTVGPISGCHLNPAVTFGMLLSRRISSVQAAGYMVAQVAGGVLAAAFVWVIANGKPGFQLGDFAANGYGQHSPEGYSMMAAFLVEMVLTMVLVITVLGSTDEKAPVGFAGLAIGLVLAAIIPKGIPVSNASFNPARSIGPAVFVGGWAISQLWLFIVAPMIGGAIAAGVYMTIRESATLITAKRAEQALPSEQAERRR
ncbi:MAG: aquaporin Z [Candidatus Angelobacter sp. Gp1-AA117]|nr:MAG: aquaporin Z [Candidatus Angelobacter sp. Gp1-AA117]